MKTQSQVIDLSQPIIITMESFSHLKDAKLVSDDGKIFETTLINCDVISRNRTLYMLEDVMASMQHDFVAERINQKVFFCEAEHPFSESGDETMLPLKRLMRVEPSRWVCRIDSYWADGSDIKGIVQWCGPFGETYRDLLVNHGSNFAMSIRAYTPAHIVKEDANGKYVIKKHLMYIASYDCVTKPGLRDARIMNPNRYTEITRNDKITTSTKIGSIEKISSENFSEVCYKNVIDEIRDMSRSQESMDIASTIFGIDFEKCKMAITGKNSLSVVSEEGTRLDLPMNHTLLSRLF